MQLQVIPDGTITRVLLDGRLDMAGVQAVQNQFMFQVGSRNGPVIVDCSKLAFIASLGISMLVTVAKSLQRKGHKLSLLRPQPLVEETLRTVGIDKVIPILRDEAEAQDAKG